MDEARAKGLSLLLAIVSSIILFKAWLHLRKPHVRYPPGPQPKFLIGNLFDIPKDHAARKYLEMAKKYRSDIIHLSAFGQHIVVLNKLELAKELLERRAQKYSGRLEAPPMKLLSVSIPLDMTYGYDARSLEDPVVVAATKSFEIGGPLMSPTGSLMNIFPFLRHVPAWFPGAVSQRKCAEVACLTKEVKRIPMEDFKRRMVSISVVRSAIHLTSFRLVLFEASGKPSPSLVYEFLESKSTRIASDEEEKIIANVAYTVYGGAADTTISATASFFYLMVANPEVQKRAQEEIDSMIGPDRRLPDFGDRPALPYVEAVYRELLRYQPPDGLGLCHLLSEDDDFEDYFLPKGTRTNFSQSDFLMKVEYSMEMNASWHMGSADDKNKMCVGQHVASSTMWMIIVSVLAAFKIEKARDEFGNEIPLNDEFADDGIS
ncbi:hypothetical protein NLJ89_g7417 [Agrocybe chaxingu]|uniref:Cytochrome P450 n=1 Tax=Agrocybe chaxingu TaxID=84603 RepID=A0A9W8MV34_9AGAR|nr:hypothetical protein NLJ89_g7417 [Agrocybe chaxingu]